MSTPIPTTRTGATFKGKFMDRQRDSYIMELTDRRDRVEERLWSTPPSGNRNNDNPGPFTNKDGNKAPGGNNRRANVENSVNGEPQETCPQFIERIMDETDYEDRHGRQDDITKKVRVDVPDFFGRMDVKVFTDWITTLKY